MSHFWSGLFENLRDRGRNAGLFLFVLPALLVAALIAAKIPDSIYRDHLIPALPWAALAIGLLGVRAVLRARARRRDRLGRAALSYDELRKARARLAPKPTPPVKNSLVPPG